jgi:hypothetical protein
MQVQLYQFQIGREGLDKLSTAVRSSTKFLCDYVVVQLFIPTFFLSFLTHAFFFFFEKKPEGIASSSIDVVYPIFLAEKKSPFFRATP